MRATALEVSTLNSDADDERMTAAADVIVRAFAHDERRRAPRKLILDYIKKLVKTPDEGVVVVGVYKSSNAIPRVCCALTVAYDGGASLDPRGDASPAPNGEAYLANLACDAQLRRRGYARQLVREADAIMYKKLGGEARAMYLHTEEGSAAHALFLSVGYEDVAPPPSSSGLFGTLFGGGGGGGRPRTLLMRRSLSASMKEEEV